MSYNQLQDFVHIYTGFARSYFGYTCIMTHTACTFVTDLFLPFGGMKWTSTATLHPCPWYLV